MLTLLVSSLICLTKIFSIQKKYKNHFQKPKIAGFSFKKRKFHQTTVEKMQMSLRDHRENVNFVKILSPQKKEFHQKIAEIIHISSKYREKKCEFPEKILEKV